MKEIYTRVKYQYKPKKDSLAYSSWKGLQKQKNPVKILFFTT